MTQIYELKDGDTEIRKVASYMLPPKKALVNYIMQSEKKDYNWWNYPETIEGIRESDTVKNHWYYDTFSERGESKVLAAFPA